MRGERSGSRVSEVQSVRGDDVAVEVVVEVTVVLDVPVDDVNVIVFEVNVEVTVVAVVFVDEAVVDVAV